MPNTLSDLEKLRTLLRGLHKDFPVIGTEIRMSDRSFTDAVSHLIVEESSKSEIAWLQKAMTAIIIAKDRTSITIVSAAGVAKRETFLVTVIPGKCASTVWKRHILPKICWNNSDSASYRDDRTDKKSRKTAQFSKDEVKPCKDTVKPFKDKKKSESTNKDTKDDFAMATATDALLIVTDSRQKKVDI